MRMIDADEVRKNAVPHIRGNYGYSADIRKWAVLVGDIDDAPTIDAVPVVRCKDCKFFKYGDYCCEDKMEHSHAREDDFCSYGEKEADGNG